MRISKFFLAIAASLVWIFVEFTMAHKFISCSCPSFLKDAQVTAKQLLINRMLHGSCGLSRVILDVVLRVLAQLASRLSQHLFQHSPELSVKARLIRQQVFKHLLVLNHSRYLNMVGIGISNTLAAVYVIR